MAHIPVNHPARTLYRIFAALIGLYILVFGVIGVIQTWGEPLFDRGDHWVLGLRTNLAFALISVIFGAVIIIGTAQRGNLGHFMNLTIGVIFMVTALLMMAVLQTEANFLNFSMSTVIVSMIFGLLVLATGLYDKVGPPAEAARARAYPHRPVSSPAPDRRR
ncbi:hypothetical protein GCM10027280_11310 [Micromonospora polyrhachis]|uniref:Membrane-associated HD superfamily phosphohydrolase n=1 Tax=Micromonospora polyrhachis TaxID=1282883 RepID=A0A7W7WQU3_9ACTN|nr:DUF4383 domain-containing protein [Micromonospora polyrhachis]MBB4959867.1 membrane-associated HD superfamily phosphohydrolase [Micromonospora polyrhachis]